MKFRRFDRIPMNALLLIGLLYALGASSAAFPSQFGAGEGSEARWNHRPDTSTAPVRFSLIGTPYHAPLTNADCCVTTTTPAQTQDARPVHYEVPRNFLTWMDSWNGGPQTLVAFKVTYPGFAPLTEATRSCLSATPAFRPANCIPIEFILRRGGPDDPPDEVMFENKRSLFRTQEPKSAEGGFELFETGPENARINTYRKKTSEHTLIIDCMMDPAGSKRSSVCGTHSRLKSGNVVEVHLYADQLEAAESIDQGVRGLLNQFENRLSR